MDVANDYPRLCGGTFFTLLLEAADQKLKERKKFGDHNNFTEPDVFEALVNIALIGCSRSSDNDNYKSAVGAYKCCNTSKSGRIPISEQAVISTFDSNIKNEYQVPLSAMNAFVENYINAEGKGVWLVKALLELIDIDKNTDGAEFYISQDGLQTKKAALGGVDEYCLPALLLGVWHYIIKNVQDNSVGKATYDEWRKPGKSPNTREDFKSDIGDGLNGRKITLVPYAEVASNVDETIYNEEATKQDEPTTEYDDCEFAEEIHIDTEKIPLQYQQHNYNQTINVNSDNNTVNGFVFNMN